MLAADVLGLGLGVIAWLLCAILATLIGTSKGRTSAGATVGLLLGVIGVVWALLMESQVALDKQHALLPGLGSPTAPPPPPRVPRPEAPPVMRPCPKCGGLIDEKATRCGHCMEKV